MQDSSHPYPFLVVTMAASRQDVWESTVREVKDDRDLEELVSADFHAAVAFAVLKSLYPVRLSESYMYIPVKKQFFEVFFPFGV